jgi:hypothetical protein
MQQSNPLKVIINPPDILLGMPGDTLQLHATITNQGNQDARIYVYFDEAFQNLNLSNNPLQECLSLASQKSYEVSFEFQIPTNTPPGTYNYRLIVDAPEDYPEETPISFPLQIQVLIKEQTKRRGADDPTFTVKPATNPNNPLIYKLGQPLQLTVTVNNRCQQVDRFRLTCPDLDETWFTIRYPKTGFEGAGVLSQNGLELNDYSQGEILLEIHPPADAFAGTYPPTIRLHSQNRPDLILLDLVYITIPEVYSLDVELNTILGKVSRVAGKYELKLTNKGNTTRELFISGKTQDEEELCNYKFEPSQVRLLPTKSVDVSLTAKPLNYWRQPWFGSGLFINFQLEIQDQKQLPLPEKLPQGTLVWKARPWWQFLLLLLLILGILGGSALIIWRILRPVPVLIDEFKPNSYSYEFGNKVLLNWQIRNINHSDKVKLSIIAEGANPKQYIIYESRRKINEEFQKACSPIEENILRCNNYQTEAKFPGKYIFKLEANNSKGTPVEKRFEVNIKQPPKPEIVDFKLDKQNYQKGQPISLSWQISNYEQLANLEIIMKQENGAEASLGKLDFTQLQKQCQNQKDNQLICSYVIVGGTTPGTYNFVLQPTAKPPSTAVLKPVETKVNVLPKPFKIKTFTLNGSSQSPQTVEEGQEVTLNWEVEGDKEDINVKLSTDGKVSPVDSKRFNITRSLDIEIEVTDKYGQQPDNKIIRIEVKPKANPSPTPLVPNVLQSPVVPTPPSNNETPVFRGF